MIVLDIKDCAPMIFVTDAQFLLYGRKIICTQTFVAVEA